MSQVDILQASITHYSLLRFLDTKLPTFFLLDWPKIFKMQKSKSREKENLIGNKLVEVYFFSKGCRLFIRYTISFCRELYQHS